jgi:hypothetical protein
VQSCRVCKQSQGNRASAAGREQRHETSSSNAVQSKAAGLIDVNIRSHNVMNFSVMLLAISVVIQLFLIGADRHDDLFTASIESTELWYNPWPAPNDQANVADGPCRIPSRVCVPADDSQTSASNGVRAAF